MKYLTYFATCYFFTLVVSFDVFNHISSAFNAIGNEISKVSDTVNTGIDAVGNEFSKVPNIVNSGIDAIGNEFSKVSNTINIGINAVGHEISKVPNTVNSGIDAIGNEVSKVPNTINTGIDAVGHEISKVPNTINTGIDAIGNEVSKVPNTVNTGIDAIGNEFSKVPNTINTGIDAIGNEVSKVPNTVNTGIDAVSHEMSKVPKLLSDVGCSNIVTGIVISLLIECNPHAFIADTLDSEDVIMMNTCKSIEIASIALPLIADLATSPVQVICTMWVEDRLDLYSHLKGIDVQTGPYGINVIDNDELFYNLSKLNEYCNEDCNLDDYEFIKPDERNEPPVDPTSSGSDDVKTRFKRGIFGKMLSIPTKGIAKKFLIQIAPKFLMKNGVPSSLAFRGLRGSVSIKMTAKTSVMILNIREKRLSKINDVYDIFVLTKTVPTTYTTKYYVNVNKPYHFGRAAAKNFQRELMNKKWKLLHIH